ncbi:transcriptional regulator, LacI family (plasmid) [Dinoroseobacter shibae DFL 12 = DSM 16493]|uniref:Transcriptional regulator, LacI family n=1 Tax=Dinoroseobacter shibae (strain DSM 16493 / NCIMB 14021 / DFL 12) TaxID=398580 RepID=A8LUL0_DINSH|nr:LacI family DNA-binding transcriptional regulator [Dinoroseobacter shibae]ABV95927.1 transcriptional regulator, LacI family [Dinoroseobacter shibae DFL 12 = DSM 16493]URF49169.1 LacI family DNA-binding transcriptional regulator [Dinoroseobacter shibae]URF53477.1 LacI family DNA-binding transcriptional regulator [Dinoroseobacter shibae]
MPDGDSRPTLKHVAARAGVSLISASRVMRGAPNVSEALRAKVEAAAADLGYSRNRIAGSLRSQASDLIAVIVPSMSNHVFPPIVDGIDTALRGSRFRPVLGMTGYETSMEETILRDLLSWTPAAVILSGLEHSPGTRALLRRHDGPVIELLDTDAPPIDLSVGVSQAAAGRMMAAHLIDRGYSRIGFVGAWGGRDTRATKRQDALARAVAAAGLAPLAQHIADAPSSLCVGADALRALRRAHPELDAVVFANDDLALGALFACQSDGIAVPDTLALAGFNGLDMCQVITPRLTTIQTPRFEIGQQAGTLLRDRLSGKDTPPPAPLPLHLVAGETT